MGFPAAAAGQQLGAAFMGPPTIFIRVGLADDSQRPGLSFLGFQVVQAGLFTPPTQPTSSS